MTEAVGFCSPWRKLPTSGNDDVDTCGGNAVDLLNGAGDLTFERPHAGDLLHEGCQAKRADLVEKLVAGIGAVGQAVFGQQQPGLARLAGLNLNALPIGAGFEVDAGARPVPG